MSFGHINPSRVHPSRTLLSQLAEPLTQQSAFQANAAPPDRRRVVFTTDGNTVLQEPCVHAEKVYDTPESVPITVCERCSSIVVPETAHSVVARAVPLPHSMMRDHRWQQLLQMYNEHWRVKSDVQKILRNYEALLVRAHRWRDAYTRTGALVDYRAQHNPMYRALEDSIKRVANVVTGFEQTIDSMLVDARRKLLREVQRCVPRRQEDFVRAMKRLIGETRRAPLYHPNAGSKCTLCDDAPCFIMLHSPTRSVRMDESARLHEALFGTADIPEHLRDRVRAERPGATERPCSCREFSVCIDCLLKWYWESSQALTKTFAQCPLCRADFHLEDIVPIYDGSATRQEAPRQEAPVAQASVEPQQANSAQQALAHEQPPQQAQAPAYHANITVAPQSLGALVDALLNEPIEVDWSQVSPEDQQYLLFHLDLPIGNAHAAPVDLDSDEHENGEFASLGSAQSSAGSDAEDSSESEQNAEMLNAAHQGAAAGAA